MKNRSALRAALPAALALCLVALPAAAVPQDVADVTTGITQVEWTPHHGYAGFRLVVSGPDGVVERHFDGGDRPLFSLAELSVASDGMYKWTLTGTPELPNAAIAELKAEGDAPNRGLVTRPASDLPTRMSGSFRVVDGAIVQRDLREEPGARLAPDRASGGAAAANAPLSRATAADQVIPDDLIVQMSLCVGFDCANGESFSFDTIRLKENNTRIKFQDTSTGSFPTVDWQLTANDSANGGLSKFSIEQTDPSPSIPFTIEAGAGSHALYVDDGERVGLSTNSPVVELHIVDGDTPTVRLEQDTSSGFQAQVWDVAGNETNFFVRDVTGGSRLPFRIRPGALTSSIDIAGDGDVGIGTASPGGQLHVQDDVASPTQPTLLVTNGSGPPRLEQTNGAGGHTWRQTVTGTGEYNVDDILDGIIEFSLAQNGNLTISGNVITTNCPAGCGPDYVFEEGYDLMTLGELEAYIEENGHLPNVPSAVEMETNGIDMTRLQLSMLEKIEELTLYLLEQEQKMVGQQQNIEGLLQEIESLKSGAEK